MKKLLILTSLLFSFLILATSCGKEEVRITFKQEDGTVIKEVVAEKGSEIIIPIEEKEGHTFLGWYLEDQLVEGTHAFETNAVLVAKFSINEYTYKFYVDGEVIKEEKLPYGATIVYPEAPSKEATASETFEFVGWDNDATVLKKDENFNAKFESSAVKYTYTFLDANDEVITTATEDYGSKIVYPEAPSKEETVECTYVFKGWDSAAETLTENIVFKPVFEKVMKQYTYKFVDADGFVYKEDKVDYGTMPTAPDNPTKEGYEFKGWDKEIEKVTGDMIYTAIFEEVEVMASLEGLKVSFVGDSITTFYSEGSPVNSYYGGENQFYYPLYSATVKTVDLTWWYKLINNNKMELGINNSWSGSAAYGSGASAGQSDSRINTLDENGTPDMVIIYLGTNDLVNNHSVDQFASAIESIITKVRALGVKDVFLFTLGYTAYTGYNYTEAGRVAYNAKLREIATSHECGIIPLDDYIINDNYMIYLGDNLHYNAKGADLLSKISEKHIKEYYGIEYEGEIEVEHQEVLPEGIIGKLTATANAGDFYQLYADNIFFVPNTYTNPKFSLRIQISKNEEGVYYISAINQSGEVCSFESEYVIIVSESYKDYQVAKELAKQLVVGTVVEFNESVELPLEITFKKETVEVEQEPEEPEIETPLPEGALLQVKADAGNSVGYWGNYASSIFFVTPDYSVNAPFAHKIEIKKGENGKYYVSAIRPSGETFSTDCDYILIISEGHTKYQTLMIELAPIQIGMEVRFDETLTYPVYVVFYE